MALIPLAVTAKGMIPVVVSSKFISPAEVKLRSPEVIVDKVRSPDVTLKLEAPIPSMEKAPDDSRSIVLLNNP